MATTKRYDVKDLARSPEGKRRIEWADRQMPVLAAIRDRFEREQPLSGYRVSACLHVTTETANLMRTLKAGGAEIVLCASNPPPRQDDGPAASWRSTTCPSSRSRARTTTRTTRTSKPRSTTSRS